MCVAVAIGVKLERNVAFFTLSLFTIEVGTIPYPTSMSYRLIIFQWWKLLGELSAW